VTISKELITSILAMDSYNRGYNAGIVLPSGATRIGTATIGTDSTAELGEQVTKSTGFYAISYKWGNETVISYRGTDNPDLLGLTPGASDIWSGWITGTGTLINAKQAALAEVLVEKARMIGGGRLAGEMSAGPASLLKELRRIGWVCLHHGKASVS
jgi:hypothetical protein